MATPFRFGLIMEAPKIRLMHYDPRWRQEFEQTRSNVLHSCEGWVTAVEHVGSTAISGLIAQPILDLLAGVDEEGSMEPASVSIEGLNFRPVELPGWVGDDFARMLQKPRHGEPTHRILLLRRDGAAWRRAVRLRDWLRDHAELAIRFEEAKVSRWKQGEGDPDSYEADKAIFFAHLEGQIPAGEE